MLAELLELAPSGVEERDVDEEVVEYAIYGAAGELPTLPNLKAVAGGALVEVATELIADDWSERWRRFHVPLVVDGKITVRPPWEPPAETALEIVIDPGQAFGTGSHATTALCLELMLAIEVGGRFLDLGCGSGVLAITAAKLGFDPVIALDNDPASVDVAKQNGRVNGVQIEVGRHDLRTDPVATATTVAANLLAPLLKTWAGRLRAAATLPQRVIASGLLSHEADALATAFSAVGLAEEARRERAGWAALLLSRVDSPAQISGRPR